MSNITYRDYPRGLQANVPQRIGVTGDFWELRKVTGEVVLEFDQGVKITRGEGDYGPGSYREVQITSPIDQTITISLGYTDGRPPGGNRTTFAGTINADVAPITVQTSLPDVLVPAGNQVMLAPADPDRRELTIRWPVTADGALRIGDSTTAANKGMELLPSDGYLWSGTAACYGYNTGANDASARLLAGKAP